MALPPGGGRSPAVGRRRGLAARQDPGAVVLPGGDLEKEAAVYVVGGVRGGGE